MNKGEPLLKQKVSLGNVMPIHNHLAISRGHNNGERNYWIFHELDTAQGAPDRAAASHLHLHRSALNACAARATFGHDVLEAAPMDNSASCSVAGIDGLVAPGVDRRLYP